MNQMNMGGFNASNGALGNMPMPNHGPNGVGGRMPDDHEDTNYEAKLNAYIYGYFCAKGKWDLARALKDSGVEFDPPLVNDNANGANDSMQTDSKDGIDLKRPDDLPDLHQLGDGQGGSFLSSWFATFWDIFSAQRKSNRASASAMQYVTQTQQQARMRSEQQNQMLRAMPGINPGQYDYQQMLRLQNVNNGNLQRKALENNRGGYQPTPHQIAQMQRQGMMQGMRRDPSDMDMNGQRPRTPSAGDHAPSPNKRQRIDGVPYNGAPHMMPNGRVPPGMPGQMMGGDSALNANHLLMNNGINPGNLSDSQFASFQQQNPAVQQKSIQVYAQNLAKNQRQQSLSNAGGMSDQGSPLVPPGMDLGVGGPEFYGGPNPGAIQMRGGVPPGAPNGAAGSNHALQDYQMQLMLLEQQNKKRLLMARQEQDTIGSSRPDGPGGIPGAPSFAPGMSPSGSRGGPSPGPSDQARRGTPKMPQTTGLPGSPMPDGSMRGSPLPFNPIQQEMYPHMNGGGMRPPPSSHPQFNNGQNYTPEQMVAIQKSQNGGRMNGNWQQGPPGQAPMIQAPQPQQGVQMGTPQQRNEMPPPQAVPNAAANGRPASPTAPPTPQTTSKANPKGKKDPRERKKPTKKGSTASVPPTPASEAELPPTPTPATPVTPQNAASFAPSKADGQGPANMMPGMASNAPDQLAPPQQDAAMSGFNGLDGAVDESYSMPFNGDLNNSDILENFDFEQFLQSTDSDFNFDPSTFDGGAEIEIGGGS